MGWVYLIRNEDLHKIGITNDIERRMSELKPTEVVKVVNTRDPRKLEKRLHKKYSLVRIPQSEYFRLSKFQVESAKKLMGEIESGKRPPRMLPQYRKSEAINPTLSNSTCRTGRENWTFEKTNTKVGESPIHNLNNPPSIQKTKSQKPNTLFKFELLRTFVRRAVSSPIDFSFRSSIILLVFAVIFNTPWFWEVLFLLGIILWCKLSITFVRK